MVNRFQFTRVPFFYPKDPCQRVFCTKGRMCVVNEDRSTTCVCPESCPEEYNPVCSVYRTEFNNKCELHKFACRLGVMVGIERQGKCDDEGSLLEKSTRYSGYQNVTKLSKKISFSTCWRALIISATGRAFLRPREY